MRVAARALSLLSLCALAACASPGDAPIDGLQSKLQACPGAPALTPDPTLPEAMVFDLSAMPNADGRVQRMEIRVVKGASDRRAQRIAMQRVEQSLYRGCPGVSRIQVRAHIGPKQAGFTNERVERVAAP